jgi:nitronate monooxygenase
MRTAEEEGPTLRALFASRRLPVIVAPMFLVSGPEMVTAAVRSGVIGAMPAPNARTVEDLRDNLEEISRACANDAASAPWMLNMIVHRTYDRFDAEAALLREFRPPLVSTALGSPARVTDAVHEYGGHVLADVIDVAMARKSVAAGVDGLVLVCNGAGGHTGTKNPFAFLAEVRRFWSGPLGLAGAISTGSDIHAAQIMGADFVVMGTRFIVARESRVSDPYRDMLVSCSIEDIVETSAVSGVLANWMRPSLESAGLGTKKAAAGGIDFSGDIASGNRAWRDVWGAGQGVGSVDKRCDLHDIVDALESDYRASLGRTVERAQ